MHQSTKKDELAMSEEQERHLHMVSASFASVVTSLCCHYCALMQTGDSGLHMRQEEGKLVIEGHLFKRASNAFKTWNR